MTKSNLYNLNINNFVNFEKLAADGIDFPV
jgi:hypothetical protein